MNVIFLNVLIVFLSCVGLCLALLFRGRRTRHLGFGAWLTGSRPAARRRSEQLPAPSLLSMPPGVERCEKLPSGHDQAAERQHPLRDLRRLARSTRRDACRKSAADRTS